MDRIFLGKQKTPINPTVNNIQDSVWNDYVIISDFFIKYVQLYEYL